MSIYLKALRAPFLTGSLTPVLAAAALAFLREGTIQWSFLGACLIGVGGVHLGANLLNDFADAKDTDPINQRVTPFSGGSRVIQDGEMSRKAVLVYALLWLALGFVMGLYLFYNGRPWVGLWGLLGLGAGVVYSLRPAYLMGRGMGEGAIFLAFGPLLTLGAYYALTGQTSLIAASLGVIPGFLITAVIWINQFPDMPADGGVGKANLVVRLGLANARWVYLALMIAPFAYLFVLAFTHQLGWLVLLGLAALPLALAGVVTTVRSYAFHGEVVKAQAKTIQTHMILTLLIAVALVVERLVRV